MCHEDVAITALTITNDATVHYSRVLVKTVSSGKCLRQWQQASAVLALAILPLILVPCWWQILSTVTFKNLVYAVTGYCKS